MIKSGNEITTLMILNQFLENPFFYLTNINEITSAICNLSDNQINELHKICSEVMEKEDEADPSKYNICFNICVICTNLKEQFRLMGRTGY